VAGKGSDQGSRGAREGWRAGLGHLLIGLAGGMGVGLLTTDVGWRGAAIIAAAGGVLLGTVRLRRFPPRHVSWWSRLGQRGPSLPSARQ
jgi:hypothetical protein